MTNILKPYSIFLDPYNFNKVPKTLQWQVFKHIPYDLNTLPNNNVLSVAVQSQNNIWIGTYGGGLANLIYSSGQWNFTPFSFTGVANKNNLITSICNYVNFHNNHIWHGTNYEKADDHGGLYELYYDNSILDWSSVYYDVMHLVSPNLTNNLILSLAICPSYNYICIGTNMNGLVITDLSTNWYHFNNFITERQPYPHNYSCNQITAFSLTKDGNYLWVGTFGSGIIKLDLSTDWNYYLPIWTDEFSLNDVGTCYADNHVTSMITDSHDTLWIGTEWGGGLVKYDGTTWTLYKNIPGDLLSLPDDYITALAIEVNGSIESLWVGTRFGGLAKLDDVTSPNPSFTRYQYSQQNLPDCLLHNFVTSIAVDNSNNNKWIGTFGGGLALFNETGI